MTIRSRLITIAVLVVLCVWFIVPRNTTKRVRDSVTGQMKDMNADLNVFIDDFILKLEEVKTDAP